MNKELISNYKKMCKDFLEIQTLNKINCLEDYGDYVYCTTCPFSSKNNEDNLACVSRNKEDNIYIAKNFLKKI